MRMAWLVFLPLSVLADEALIAVASNFNPVRETVRADFEAGSPHAIRLSSGSTGMLYAQIVNGAPYDAFLAADQVRPAKLEANGFGVSGTRFTYAEGRLALWAHSAGVIADTVRESLQSDQLKKLAIANPALAPYGSAARQALQAKGLWESVSDRLVFGENASQVFSMAALGNADASIVALSHVLLARERFEGHYLEIPATLHSPIRQDAVLLAGGADNEAARAFLSFLKRPAVREKIATYYGY